MSDRELIAAAQALIDGDRAEAWRYPTVWQPLIQRLVQAAKAGGAANLLAKNQDCGCVVCTCENDERCMGCGAKHCGSHPVGQMPNPRYEQSQASKPIAVVTGWYDGRCVIEPLDRALAIPVGMALYTTPPAAKINQQLPEGYVLAPVEPTEAMIDAGVAVAFAASVHGKGGWNNYMRALYRAFIAAAQEVGNE